MIEVNIQRMPRSRYKILPLLKSLLYIEICRKILITGKCHVKEIDVKNIVYYFVASCIVYCTGKSPFYINLILD